MSTDQQTTVLASSSTTTANASVEGQLAALEQQLAQQRTAMPSQQEEIAPQRDVIGHLEAHFDGAQPAKHAEAAREAEPPALILPAAVSRRQPGTERPQTTKRGSRRALLKLGGAAAAAVGAGVLLNEAKGGTAHAAPAHADPATFQQSASGSGNIAIEGDGTSGAWGVVGTSDSFIGVEGDTVDGWAVAGFSTGTGGAMLADATKSSGAGLKAVASSGNGVYGASAAPGTSAGVYGFGSDANGKGVWGYSASGTGVEGQTASGIGVDASATSGFAVQGTSTTGYGGVFDGGLAPLHLVPAGSPGAPTSGIHLKGDVYVDSNGVVWVCVFASGILQQWVRLTGVASGASGGATTFLSTPIRLLDTRSGYGAATTPGAPIPKYNPMAPNPFHLPVAGVSYNPGTGLVTIPAGAKAFVGNCTVVNPAGEGDLAAYPDLLSLPNTAVMHYKPVQFTLNSVTYTTGNVVSNGITIGLGTNGKLAIAALGSATDVIIDCQGFIM